MKFQYGDLEVNIESLRPLEPLQEYEPLPDIFFDEVVGDKSAKYTQRNIVQQQDFNGKMKTILILNTGDFTLFDSRNILQIKDCVYFCSGKYVCKWNITLRELQWRVELDQSVCFTLESIENDKNIIVSGELILTKIDLDGHILWHYSGSDILVTVKGQVGAEILEDKIHVLDWNNILHILDFEGNLIESKLNN